MRAGGKIEKMERIERGEKGEKEEKRERKDRKERITVILSNVCCGHEILANTESASRYHGNLRSFEL